MGRVTSHSPYYSPDAATAVKSRTLGMPRFDARKKVNENGNKNMPLGGIAVGRLFFALAQ